MRLSRRSLDFWLHLALLSLYLGTFSVFGVLKRLSSGLGSAALLGLVLLTLALAGCAVWRAQRFALAGIVLLGLLPFGHFAYFYLSGASTDGAFIYLYKFAPFVLAPFLWRWARDHDDALIERTLTLLGLVVAVRALVAFAVPSLAVAPSRAEAADDFVIYEWVAGLPRVFFPGMALLFFGLITSLDKVFSRAGRGVQLELAKAALFLAALLTTLSRGTILTAVLLAALYVALKLFRARGVRLRKTQLLLGGLFALSGLMAAVAVTPLSDSLTRTVERLRGQERFSLNGRTLDWRDRQSQLAFSLVNTDEKRALGVGTNTSIVADIENPNPWVVTNDIHYSYDSIRWTFGWLGLGLLVGFAIVQPLGRAAVTRPRARLVWPFALTAVFIAVIGTYTIVFTVPDWNVMLCLCAAYLNARAPRTRPLRSRRFAPHERWSPR